MPAGPRQQPIDPLPPERFRELLGDRYPPVAEAIARAPVVFRGRAIWHVNSTARGGGVVELLQSLLAYTRGAGVDARWMVIAGDPASSSSSPSASTTTCTGRRATADRSGTRSATSTRPHWRRTRRELVDTMRPGDIVFLHDPQTAGLVEAVRETGATVVWRCHVGVDRPNEVTRRAWDFMRPYVAPADAYVFSRAEFAWEGLDPARTCDRPSLDRRLLAQEPGDGARGGARHPRHGRSGGRRGPGPPTFVRAGRQSRPGWTAGPS